MSSEPTGRWRLRPPLRAPCTHMLLRPYNSFSMMLCMDDGCKPRSSLRRASAGFCNLFFIFDGRVGATLALIRGHLSSLYFHFCVAASTQLLVACASTTRGSGLIAAYCAVSSLGYFGYAVASTCDE
mmetsp:Transcript_30694/g.93969  ORF Transcript_30694/g.93969 Transcript_30694/m.93969 type:complete len:127 (+) Transcript_30694:544-924(+)